MKSSDLDVATCRLDGINLIEASAGTGKTWTICGLYLRLLLERNLTVQQVLVVTFTNAATAELRERIRARLVELQSYLTAPAAPTPVVLSAASAPPETAVPPADVFIETLSRRLLRTLKLEKTKLLEGLELALQSFDEASIFTIHGFCQRALADNPFGAALPMSLALIEDDDALVMEAVHDFWRRHVASDSVAADFARYLHACKDTPKHYARLLKRHLAKPLARTLWPADIDSHAVVAAASLDTPYRSAQSSWRAARREIVTLLLSALPALDGKTYKEQAILTAAECWDTIFRDDDPLAVVEDKASLYCATKLAAKTKKNRGGPAHDFFILADAYLDARRALVESLARQRARLLRRLFDEAGRAQSELKLARRVVSFNDMLTNLHERLHNPDYPGFGESLRTRFPVGLIDEFQDTDPLQFDIFRTIYAAQEPCVFLVGDPKQAIYSFRNADLHTYLRAKSWTDRQWSLLSNQRSSKPLLAGLNALFARNPDAFILPGLRYTAVAYGTQSRKVFVDHTAAGAPLHLWALPDQGGVLQKSAARHAALRATAAEVARLIREARAGRITLDGAPLRPRDIAILVRSRAVGGDMKRALAQLRVGAVEMSRDSILVAPEAEDIERVMTAVLRPSRNGWVRAALATELFGYPSTEIERLAGDEVGLLETINRFVEYRELWLTRGFGVMFRRLLTEQAVAGRLLARLDGERRLTNILHLGEMLSHAAQREASPEALLRFFKAARSADAVGDALQLRLESDQNLVQIVTIHSCKGLEYPIVFCPFLCDGATRFGGPDLEGDEYHDANFESVVDFRGQTIPPDERSRIDERIDEEQAAESVRLLYVALTRAVHRCYLVAGSYTTGATASIKESTHSRLNWLAAGAGMSPSAWSEANLTAADITLAWQRLAAAAHGAIDVTPLPFSTGIPLDPIAIDAASLSVLTASDVVRGWRVGSYSSLSHGATSEQAADDRDARVEPRSRTSEVPAGTGEDDILRFPRGATAGECIHTLFENVDFTDGTGWQSAVDAALAEHPQVAERPDVTPQESHLAPMLLTLLKDVTEATLIPGLQLRSIHEHQRLTELEFTYPVAHLSAGALNGTLAALGYRVPSLTFKELEGYLKGFIDLVFEHQGRFYILDWKSNHLGYEGRDYAAAALERAMSEHGYHLQHLLYTVALHRYLGQRVRNYDYDEHFGGVLYLFVRGIRSAWNESNDVASGVYFHRARIDAVRSLERVLESAARSPADS